MFTFPDNMLQVFKDENSQREFEQNGYVILPFYTEDELKQLKEVYYRLHPHNESGFFPSTFSKDKAYRNTADSEIRRIGQRSLEQYCQNFKVVCGSYIVKSPDPGSGMCVHQDMSLVDESKFTGVNIWAPLVDLTIENGALFVLPGSHRLFPTYRGSSIPEFFSPVMDKMIDYLHPITINAGQAVFFDQSIIHFSPPNYSDDIRIVTNTYFTHETAQFRTYYWAEEFGGKVEVFDQAEDFMTNFEQFGENIHDRPKVGRSLGLIEYDFPKIDEDFLTQRFKKTNARSLIEKAIPPQFLNNTGRRQEKKRSVLSRLKELFN
jgi:hypothetical protein